MSTGRPRPRRAALTTVLVGVVLLTLTACTGRGGGKLPPDGVVHSGPASFGFSFSCEDKGGVNPPTGQLRIQLSYTEHGVTGGETPLDAPFSIHGTVDTLDPGTESAICIGQEPPPGANELIFLGQYRLTSSSAPRGFPEQCAVATAACRFEVVVRDDDGSLAPSAGDEFTISLSSASAVSWTLGQPAFYVRGGTLSSGNLTVG